MLKNLPTYEEFVNESRFNEEIDYYPGEDMFNSDDIFDSHPISPS